MLSCLRKKELCTLEQDTNMYTSGTTASAHSSSAVRSVHPLASSSLSSSSSGGHGQYGQVLGSVPDELGKSVIA